MYARVYTKLARNFWYGIQLHSAEDINTLSLGRCTLHLQPDYL